MARKTHRLQAFVDQNDEWRWRLRCIRGGQIVAVSGEGYTRFWSLKRAVDERRFPLDWGKIEVAFR
jgi:uncharacterized protein YegP (UPF0339 family)